MELPIGVFWYSFAELMDSQNKYHIVVNCKTSNILFLFHFILDVHTIELFLSWEYSYSFDTQFQKATE